MGAHFSAKRHFTRGDRRAGLATSKATRSSSSALTVSLSSNPEACSTVSITWSVKQGTAPWTITVAPANALPISIQVPASDIPSGASEVTYKWSVPDFTSATQALVAVSDSAGSVAGVSDLVTIASGSGSCTKPASALDFVWYESDTTPSACETWQLNWEVETSSSGIVKPVEFVLLPVGGTPLLWTSSGTSHAYANFVLPFDEGTQFLVAAFDSGKSGTGGVGPVYTVASGKSSCSVSSSLATGLAAASSTASASAVTASGSSSTSSSSKHSSSSTSTSTSTGHSSGSASSSTTKSASASSTGNASDDSSSSSKTGTHSSLGAIAGGVVGALAASILLALALMWWWKKRKQTGSVGGSLHRRSCRWPEPPVVPWRWEVVDGGEKGGRRSMDSGGHMSQDQHDGNKDSVDRQAAATFDVRNVHSTVPDSALFPAPSPSNGLPHSFASRTLDAEVARSTDRPIASVVPDDALFPRPPPSVQGAGHSTQRRQQPQPQLQPHPYGAPRTLLASSETEFNERGPRGYMPPAQPSYTSIRDPYSHTPQIYPDLKTQPLAREQGRYERNFSSDRNAARLPPSMYPGARGIVEQAEPGSDARASERISSPSPSSANLYRQSAQSEGDFKLPYL